MDEQPNHQDEEDPRPWELAGNFRRDCEPYQGHFLYGLAWIGVACAGLGTLLPPLVCLGFLVSCPAWIAARRHVERMHLRLLDPCGLALASDTWRLARAAAITNAALFLFYVAIVLRFVC